MPNSGVSGTAGIYNAPTSDYFGREHKSVLDKDDFMRLLITQLANQDPTNPMEDREFIAQMAQFSALEQMHNLNTQLFLLRESPTQLSHLIGKQVTWENQSGENKTGLVDAVVYKQGLSYVEVDGELVLVMNIVGIKEWSEPSEGTGDSELVTRGEP